jgi:hypothetical protein
MFPLLLGRKAARRLSDAPAQARTVWSAAASDKKARVVPPNTKPL